ncbi:MAG: NAD(P)-dependent oxidoreductase, partial [Usitatibacteraceae bacterium]
VGYHPNPERVPPFVQGMALDALLATSDFISLNCPLNDSTRHLLSAARLALIKPTAFIVNAARGEVIDDSALALALKSRRIAGAAIDVYSAQPLPREHPFFALDNVVLTPHVAALTDESFEKMSTGAARQILQLIRGERPQYLVNPEVWESYPYRRTHEGRAS